MANCEKLVGGRTVVKIVGLGKLAWQVLRRELKDAGRREDDEAGMEEEGRKGANPRGQELRNGRNGRRRRFVNRWEARFNY